MSETSKQLELQLKQQLTDDKNKAVAKRIVDKIPEAMKQFVLDELSRELAAKGEVGNVK